MTAAQIRGSKRIRSNAERGKERLEGFAPVIEDWHAKLCLLEVSIVVSPFSLTHMHFASLNTRTASFL